MTVLGAALLAIASYALIISYATYAIPTKWPFAPLERDGHPELFRWFVAAWWVAAAVGASLLATSFF